MKKSTKFIMTGVSVALAFCVLALSGILAWFAINDGINNMSFKIAKINSTVRLYYGVDDNYNGVPELLSTPITSANTAYYTYYTDVYNFYEPVTQFGNAVYAEDFALSEEPTDVTLDIAATDVFPSRVYTYKLSLLNRGDASNTISMKVAAKAASAFTAYTGTSLTEASLMKTLSVRIGTINRDGTMTFGSKVYFADSFNADGDFSESTLLSGQSIMGIIEAGTTGANYLDYWLQIEMEPYDALAAKYGSSFMTKDNYNALMGKSLTLPYMKIYFEVIG